MRTPRTTPVSQVRSWFSPLALGAALLLPPLGFAGTAAAQPENPPPSPIDRPKGERFAKPAPPPPQAEAKPLLPPRQARQGWIGWSVGSGYGWHPAGTLENQPGLNVAAGSDFAKLGHFGAEIGVQWNDDLALSLHTRHQVIPRKGGTASQWAHSLLGRAVWLFQREGAQLFAGGVLGGGQGFRFRIDPQPSQNLDVSDTVRGGPFVVGPTVGFFLPLLEKLSLVAEARALIGVPNAAGLFEVNLGAQFDLFGI